MSDDEDWGCAPLTSGEETRVQRALSSLRDPDPSLAAVANKVRQSLADVITEQQAEIERLRVALRMISRSLEKE